MIALALIFLTYALLFSSRPIRTNPNLRATLILVVTAHHLAALFHSQISLLPGADQDAEGFYRAADPNSASRLRTMLYVRFLRLIFSFAEPSRLLACELSITAFVVACILIVKLSVLIEAEAFAPRIILIFGILPSSLVHFSTPLRESFQMLSVVLIALSVCKLMQSFSLAWLAAFLCSELVLLNIHASLKNMVFGILGLAVLAILRKLGRGFYLAMALAFAVLSLYTIIGSAESPDASLASELGKVETYRAGVKHAAGRAYYGGQVDASSLGSVLLTLPQVVVLYFISPLPTQVSSPLDMYSLFENYLRIYFIALAFLRVRKMETGPLRERYIFLIALFFWVEFVWSLGTGNWGTALRHHSVALFLPLLLGIPKSTGKAAETAGFAASKKPLSTRARIRQRRKKPSRRGREQE